MLRKEAVSATLSHVLNRLMGLQVLGNHRLVGGTALALQIGHRISVDIDLFSSQPSDYEILEKELIKQFEGEAKTLHFIHSPLGKGISLLISGVKTDILDWTKPFHFPVEEIEGIRMASREEIASMKLDIITSQPEFIRYEKKDFVDLAFLLNDFSLDELIQFYRQKNPGAAFPERLILEALQTSELADKKPHPRMLIALDWPSTKNKINKAVKSYIMKDFK